MKTLVASPSSGNAPPPGLQVSPCYRCGKPVIWCATPRARGKGSRPIAVELCAMGAGRVALEHSLIACAGQTPPVAFEVSNGTMYRWHGVNCAPAGPAFSAISFTRKVRP